MNWGNGRLVPYESEGSFTAKFCILNGLKRKEFKSFFTTYLGGSLDLYQLNYLDVKRLSLLLNESPYDVSKLDREKFALPACFGDFAFERRGRDTYRRGLVKYCSECIEGGFHSSMHEHYLIKRCPIHLSPLNEVSSNDSTGSGYYERYVNKVSDLLRAGGSQWLSFDIKPQIKQQLSRTHFQHFMRWMREVKKFTRQLQPANLLVLSEGAYNEFHLNQLLDRLNCWIPTPKVVQKIYDVRCCRLSPVFLRYPMDTLRKLQLVLQKISIEELFLVYIELARSGIELRFALYLEKALEEIRKQASNVRSHWGCRKRVWVRTNPDNWPYWNYSNPYEEAIEELLYKWFYASKNTALKYLACCKAAEVGLIRGIHIKQETPNNDFMNKLGIRQIDSYKLIGYELLMDNGLHELLQDIFLEEAMADVSHEMTWAREVSMGTTPPDEVPGQPAVGNLFVTPKEGYICLWRRSSYSN